MSPIKAESALTEMFGTRGCRIFASAQGGMLGMGPDSKDKIQVYAMFTFTYNPNSFNLLCMKQSSRLQSFVLGMAR